MTGDIAPIAVFRPEAQTAPVVFASPHSGRCYPAAFVESSRLDPLALRRSEDAFVDQMFSRAPEFGAPLLCANFPRAYVDANREAYELDPYMFKDRLPDHVITRSPRIAAGLGTIPRVVTNGEEIYPNRLGFAEVQHRIETNYIPYHQTLTGLLRDTYHAFGECLLIDCHSMPSNATGSRSKLSLPDIVLGDCHATSASPALTNMVEHLLVGLGFRVARNRPYAGGYTTRHYGQPRNGIHALQIEINRGLYLNEKRVEPLDVMATIIAQFDRFMDGVCANSRRLLLPLAAE